MSINPETDLNLDELFQPSWAKDADSKKQYSKYEPRERPDRGDRRDRPHGGGFNRPRGDSRGERRTGGGPGRGRGPGQGFRGHDRSGRPERREPPPPPEINVTLHTDDQGAESLARQIKTTGRAYPLFDIARMILQKPDRFSASFSTKKGEDGKPLQSMYVCALDDSVWLSEEEAVAHVLRNHLSTFYQAERTETEAPKGTYTFVAQCGMSGEILGPPNHHAYQTKLHELHAKRFARMPFETYKSRVKIVRDEAVVKQWVEDQSWRTEYICLNVPEAARLPDMAAVEKHFREVHLPTMIRQVDTHVVPGAACQKLRGGLYRVYRDQMDQQRRFPMQVATSLSQQFASRGLQFFKVNKTVTHVWVARPTFLDLEAEPVSETIRRIVEFINEHPKCTRRQLIESIAPSPAPASPAPAPEAAPDGGEPAPAAAPQAAAAPTPEQAAIIGDLHWLIHQGHVIEFANGLMETAKKPAPRPQPAPKKKKAKAEREPKPEGKAEEPEGSTPPQPPEPTETKPAAATAVESESEEEPVKPAAGPRETVPPAEAEPAPEASAEPTAPKPEAVPDPQEPVPKAPANDPPATPPAQK